MLLKYLSKEIIKTIVASAKVIIALFMHLHFVKYEEFKKVTKINKR